MSNLYENCLAMRMLSHFPSLRQLQMALCTNFSFFFFGGLIKCLPFALGTSKREFDKYFGGGGVG